MASEARVFIASSLDGFIAGANDDLSWLPDPSDEREDYGYEAFMANIGALLMGRRTYDVASGFSVPWPYGDRPVLVATSRPLSPKAPTVRTASGSVSALVTEAKRAAGGQDVYVDGGVLIRAALERNLIDELTVTLIPVILGTGVPLFAGAESQRRLTLLRTTTFADGVVQLVYRPVR